MKNKISAAIATFNEENSILNCLKSLEGLVDEVVIVDGSSTDKTVQIAKIYGAKILVTDNPDNFHINKQKAIDLCKGDWILQLDADEVVSTELKNEIIHVVNFQTSKLNIHKNENFDQINGYNIPRKNYFLGKFLTKGGQFPDYTLRLYKKGKGWLPCKDVHEQAQVTGKIGFLRSPLLHYSYPNFSHYLDHFNLYTTYSSKQLGMNKININLHTLFSYIVYKPILWFVSTYFRHKGFEDGFPGFVFSFFSALRFPIAYIKYWECVKINEQKK